MPTVVNGIGTWYYGKSRIHSHKGTCEFCQRVGELQSYDTTLYFVVVFVPLIPLARKRILEQCPSCQKHRLVPLKQWEEGKANAIQESLQRLQENPDDRAAIQAAIGVAVTYQDEALFDKLAPALAGHRGDDDAIQAQLGAAYGYFARWQEAEQAYRAALSVRDDAEIREQLALALLKQSQPEAAEPYLMHVLNDKRQDSAGMIFLLIEGFQANGKHEEALALIERRDQAFPIFADTTEYKRQRKTSEKYRNSGKRVVSAYLSESSKVGTHEGNWTARLPRLIAPVLLIGLLIWYFGAAARLGQSRKVYFVNGWVKPYAVAINGQQYTLPAGVTPLELPEGEISVEFRDPQMKQDPVTCSVATPFFARPFLDRTFVVNPDQLGILIWEQTAYSAAPNAGAENQRIEVGRPYYEFESLDYEFHDFPPSLRVKKGDTIRKTRIALISNIAPENRLGVIAQSLPPPEQIAYVKRWLALDPGEVYFLYWLLSQLSTPEAIAFLQTRLADRPVRVEWHRAYQSLMEREQPNMNLQPEYRRLVQETNEQPAALYLLARLLDRDEAERLLEQAAAATPPSAFALHALGWRALTQGQFADAKRWLAKAAPLKTGDPYLRRDYHASLLAAGDFERLLEELRSPTPGDNVPARYEEVRVLAAKGDKAKADAIIRQTVGLWLGPADAPTRSIVEAAMRMIVCCATNDVTGYVREAARLPDPSAFEPAFLQGRLSDAALKIATRNEPQTGNQLGLLYLAAVKAGNAGLAEKEWSALLGLLAKSNRFMRQFGALLSGPQPKDANSFLQAFIDPGEKRVLLAVAAQRFPAQKKELLELAVKLNYQRDAISLCLRDFLK